jgi:hypothetical protein
VSAETASLELVRGRASVDAPGSAELDLAACREGGTLHGEGLDPWGSHREEALEGGVLEGCHRQHGVDRGLAQPGRERVEVAAGALPRGEHPVGRHEHRQVGAEGGGDSHGDVVGRGQRLEEDGEAPGLVIPPAREAGGEVLRALLHGAREEPPRAGASSRAATPGGLEIADISVRLARYQGSAAAAPPSTAARGREPPRDAGAPPRGGPAREASDRRSPSTRPTGGTNAGRSEEEGAREGGERPGHRGAEERSGGEERSGDARGESEGRPPAPLGEGRRSERDEERDGEVGGKERLHRKPEGVEGRQTVHQRSEPGPAAQAHGDGERSQEGQPSGQGTAGRSAHGGEGEDGGAQVEAQDIRKAARKEVLTPPLVGEVRQVAVEAPHHGLDESQGMDRVGEHDVGRKPRVTCCRQLGAPRTTTGAANDAQASAAAAQPGPSGSRAGSARREPAATTA